MSFCPNRQNRNTKNHKSFILFKGSWESVPREAPRLSFISPTLHWGIARNFVDLNTENAQKVVLLVIEVLMASISRSKNILFLNFDLRVMIIPSGDCFKKFKILELHAIHGHERSFPQIAHLQRFGRKGK